MHMVCDALSRCAALSSLDRLWATKELYVVLRFLLALGFLATLTAIAFIDARVRLIPNRLVGTIAVLGVLYAACRFEHQDATLLHMIKHAVEGGALFLIFVACSAGIMRCWHIFHGTGLFALGGGDIKLMLALGLWMSPVLLCAVFGIACFACVVWEYAKALKRFVISNQPLKVSSSVALGPGIALCTSVFFILFQGSFP